MILRPDALFDYVVLCAKEGVYYITSQIKGTANVKSLLSENCQVRFSWCDSVGIKECSMDLSSVTELPTRVVVISKLCPYQDGHLLS